MRLQQFHLKKLRTVAPIGLLELQTLHTGSLLRRLRGLNRLHESANKSDWTKEEREAVELAELIAFKDTILWKDAYTTLKTVLATRSHIERSGKAARRRAQREKQTR